MTGSSHFSQRYIVSALQESLCDVLEAEAPEHAVPVGRDRRLLQGHGALLDRVLVEVSRLEPLLFLVI